MQNQTTNVNIDIPSGYYRLPKITNIGEKPEYPYQFGSKGMIHGSKVEILYETLVNEQSNSKESKRINSIFDNYGINIAGLQLDEIADFIRHFTFLNRDKLGWDVADRIRSNLKKEGFYPRWKLPGNKLDENFRPILISFIDIKFSSAQLKQIKEIITHTKENLDNAISENSTIYKLDTISKDSLERQKWDIKKLSNLYETINLLIYQLGVLDEDDYSDLIKTIEHYFESIIEKNPYDSNKGKVVCFIYCSGLLKKGIKDILKAKNILENLREQFTSTDERYEDYQWLFRSFFARISALLYEFEQSFVTRRRIIQDLLHNYLKIDTVDLPTWESHILKTKPHPLVFSYIIQGYSDMLYTLKEHAKDLIIDSLQQQMIERHENIAKFLLRLLLKYLKSFGDDNVEDIHDLDLGVLNYLQLPPSHIYDLRRSLHLAINHNLTIDDPNYEYSKNELLEYGGYILSSFYPNEYRYFFQLKSILDSGELNLERFSSKIMEEFERNDSLLQCRTFENEMVRSFANLFGFIKEQGHKYAELECYFLEILLWYLSEWVFELTSQEKIRKEAVMFISPFISMVFTKLALYYYKNNNNPKAHLMALNEYFFWIVVKGLNPYNADESYENAVEKMLNVIIDYYDFIELDIVKEDYNLRSISSAGLVDYDFKKKDEKIFESDLVNTVSEEFINDYLDLRDELNEFLRESKDLNQQETKDLILSSKLFTLPKSTSIDIFEKIGKNSTEDKIKRVPFPLIRKTNAMAIAINLFPIDLNLPNFEIDTTI